MNDESINTKNPSKEISEGLQNFIGSMVEEIVWEGKLIDRCNWEWTKINGVDGQKVTGPNGNSLFLPAAGYYYSTSFKDLGSFGGYWSNMFNSNCLDSAEGLCFCDGNDILRSSFMDAV